MFSNEVPQFGRFLSDFDLEEIDKISIICTNGSVTFRRAVSALGEAALRSSNFSVHVRVLISSAYMADAGRMSLTSTIVREAARLQNEYPCFSVEVRTYSAPAMFRGHFLHLKTGEVAGNMGWYSWDAGSTLFLHKSKWSGAGAVFQVEDQPDPMLAALVSWFDHYWGRDFINTIVFDFDDTLFETFELQVSGWAKSLTNGVSARIIQPQDLREEISDCLHDEVLLNDKVKRIFLQQQSSEQILSALFNDEAVPEKKAYISEQRFKIREQLTRSNAMPLPSTLSDIENLSRKHRLIVVSATSEDLVNKVLSKHGLDQFFSHVFGRNEDRKLRGWRSIERKTQMILQISSMIGVPVERMVFVGDSNADYLASSQLGIPFIENTFNAEKNGYATLITEGSYAREHSFTGTRSGELLAAVSAISEKLNARWLNPE